jgi:hypothetical protein
VNAEELPVHYDTRLYAPAFAVNGSAIDAQSALAEVKAALAAIFVLVFQDQLQSGSQLVVASDRGAELVAL